MRIHFLVATCLALPQLALAQAADLYNDQREGTLNNRYALGYFLTPRDEVAAQGSVFLVRTWTPGTLQVAGRAKPLALPLKYDNYRQEIRAKQANGDSVAVPVAQVREFSLAARRFVCYPAAGLPSEAGGGCGEVLYADSAVQLLRYERKTLEKRSADSGSYAATTTVPVLETHTNCFLRWPDGRFVAVKPRRASLEQALVGRLAALAALKARKGGIGSEAELAAAVAAIAPQLK